MLSLVSRVILAIYSVQNKSMRVHNALVILATVTFTPGYYCSFLASLKIPFRRSIFCGFSSCKSDDKRQNREQLRTSF